MKLKPSMSLLDLVSLVHCTNISKNIGVGDTASDKHPLRFDLYGNFKIVQFADIQDGPNTDPRTLELMNRILDRERPNLVILSGDNIDGKCKTREDVKKAITSISAPMETRRIPWAVVFGNHDDEHFMLKKEQMMNFYMTFKYNISQIGFKTSDNRIGNYNLIIKGRNSDAPEFNIYLMDSGKYSLIGLYDTITPSQICWYKTLARKLKKLNNRVIPSLMFFHIPLQEFYTAYKTGYIDGQRLEKESTSTINTGLFQTVVKCGDVKGIFVGHDHRNTYTASLQGIRLGYAGSTGYGTYGDSRLQRGARVFEVNEANPSAFNTRMIFSGDVGMN